MTQGHSTDLPILQLALEKHQFPFLGAIGSQAKAMRMKRELTNLGVPEARAEQFICPLGEKIGNNSPAEIAISITAQLLKVRDEFYQTTKRLIKN